MSKALTLLGFARKAGRLAVGTAATVDAIKRKKAYLAITASDISEKSSKEIRFLCEKHNVKFITPTFDTYEITGAIGTRAGIIAVLDEGFAAAIAENL
jgi:ribosomal protein L7Ae-like RNA K-turn-binding protein